MPLTPQQIVRLANEVDAQWDLPRLVLFAATLGINLPNLPGRSLKERAYELITHLNSPVPPRDREMLEALRQQNNALLANLANEFLRPGFFPPGDAHSALMLGRTAFVARDTLRQSLKEFTAPGQYTTHVLVVRGNQPGGKSYTWEFLRHLAITIAGVQPVRLNLKATAYKPREFLRQAMVLLGLEEQALPELTDRPQLARTSPLLNAFKARIIKLTRPYWLVIDDVNDPSVTPEVRETAYATAFVVEELRPQNLWLALLGYNSEIVDPEMRYVAQDDALFPGPDSVATFFLSVAQASGTALTSVRAKEIADVLFSKYPTLDKESMSRLTPTFEQMSEKIKAGQVP